MHILSPKVRAWRICSSVWIWSGTVVWFQTARHGSLHASLRPCLHFIWRMGERTNRRWRAFKRSDFASKSCVQKHGMTLLVSMLSHQNRVLAQHDSDTTIALLWEHCMTVLYFNLNVQNQLNLISWPWTHMCVWRSVYLCYRHGFGTSFVAFVGKLHGVVLASLHWHPRAETCNTVMLNICINKTRRRQTRKCVLGYIRRHATRHIPVVLSSLCFTFYWLDEALVALPCDEDDCWYNDKPPPLMFGTMHVIQVTFRLYSFWIILLDVVSEGIWPSNLRTRAYLVTSGNFE